MMVVAPAEHLPKYLAHLRDQVEHFRNVGLYGIADSYALAIHNLENPDKPNLPIRHAVTDWRTL